MKMTWGLFNLLYYSIYRPAIVVYMVDPKCLIASPNSANDIVSIKLIQLNQMPTQGFCVC